MKKLIQLFSCICLLSLVGCLVPGEFISNIEIEDGQHYKIDYEGTIIAALAKSQIKKNGQLSEKDNRIFKKYAAKLKKKPGFKKAEYIGDGSYQVSCFSEGVLSDKFDFLTKKTNYISINPLPNNQVEIIGVGIKQKEVVKLQELGIKINGTINLKTKGTVLKHNAQSTPKFGGFFGHYTWQIKSVDDPAPYMLIQFEK